MMSVVIAAAIVVVMMPISAPIIMSPIVLSAPIAISPIATTIVDDGRGSIVAGRLVDYGGRGRTPAEWIEIDVELYPGISG